MEKKNTTFFSKRNMEIIGAIIIGFYATLLVFCTYIDSNLNQHIIIKNVERANTYGFFQAKRIRQAVNQVIYDSIFDMSIFKKGLNSDEKKVLERKKAKIAHSIKVFNNTGNPESSINILQKAKQLELEINKTIKQEGNYAIACNIYEVAIILASIALIINSPIILILSLFVGFLGIYFHVLGLFL